jgi:hypothetical protein
MNEVYLGIDVSKESLGVAAVPTQEKWHYPNDEVGLSHLKKTD